MNPLTETLRHFRLPRPPFWLVAAAIIGVVGTWVPLTLIARTRARISPNPPIHLIQDMDHQAKLKAQSASPVFVDGRAMRPPVEGTVAVGSLQHDDHYFRGFETDADGEPVAIRVGDELSRKWFGGFPDRVKVDKRFVLRGQKMFNIYCYVCHGYTGHGDGMVNKRGLFLQEFGTDGTSWTQAANLHQEDESGGLKYGPENYPEGKIFNVITNGMNNMPGYASQIDVEDRWAIVAYVRALQQAKPEKPDDAE